MDSLDANPKGSLTVVGTGITVSGQMTLVTQSIIQNADIVLSVVTQSALVNLQQLNTNTVCMRHFYEKEKSRLHTYRQMKQCIIDEVIAGKRVVAAFYGHPGVFVNPSHNAISELSSMGYRAEMLPGISAEDCLIADLGLDPSHWGCQSYEASQFVLRQYSIDPYMMQIIWQIGSIGEFNYAKDKTEHPGLTVLRDKLLKTYQPDHEVIVYEASTIPLVPPRIEKLPLESLDAVVPKPISTLVIPATGLPEFDRVSVEQLNLSVDEIEQILKIEKQ